MEKYSGNGGETMTLYSRIRMHSNRFTTAQERIVDFLHNYAHEALKLPINLLAERCQVGDATVIRFYRLMGYENYAMFRVALAKELMDNDIHPIYEEVDKKDELADIVRKVVASSIQGIADVEKQLSLKAVGEFVRQFLKASHINVIGLGASGVVAQDAMHKLMRLGLKVNSYTDSHLMTIAASAAGEGEVFFAICHSGETSDIIHTLELAKKRGCYICALTSHIDSDITRVADDYLLSCTRETKMRSDAMISRIVQLVVIDVLYVRLAVEIGDSAMEQVNQSRLALKRFRNSRRQEG